MSTELNWFKIGVMLELRDNGPSVLHLRKNLDHLHEIQPMHMKGPVPQSYILV